MNTIKIFLLLPASVVEQLQEASADFRAFLERRLANSDHLRRFPNGAIEVDGDEAEMEMRDLLREDGTLEFGLEGRAGFRSLAPFVPKHLFMIQYLSDYQVKLRSEISFLNGWGNLDPPAPGEYKLSELEVSILFRSRLTDKVRRKLAAFVAVWAQAVSVRGAFDDGPIQLASPSIAFFGPRAQFLIDASRSGQDTINWLSLALFDFGYYGHTITQIGYAYPAEALDELPPWSGKPEFVPFPEKPTGPEFEGPESEAPSSYVPSEAVPDTNFRSQRFSVLALPDDEWDRFVVTVYFAKPPLPAERQEFTSLIQSWLLLGSYGGFGGHGIHSSQEIEFNDATDSVVIRADMGDSDPQESLNVLIQSLEGFVRGSTPIDAIVFGSHNERGGASERDTPDFRR
jgi:hypothetical protein